MSNVFDYDKNRIRAGRALLGWSQQELARHAGIAASTIADFERGKRTPTAENLKAMKDTLEGAGVNFFQKDNIALASISGSRAGAAKAGGGIFRWLDVNSLAEWANRRDAQDT